MRGRFMVMTISVGFRGGQRRPRRDEAAWRFQAAPPLRGVILILDNQPAPEAALPAEASAPEKVAESLAERTRAASSPCA